MFKQSKQTVNGHGFFRKKKWAKGLVSGIAIAGMAIFSSSLALADEVTTESITPNTGQVASQTVLEPASKELTSAIDTAKTAGVTVTEEAPQSVASAEEAHADYATQAKEIEAVTAKQEAINAENKDLQTAHDEADKTVSTVNKEVEELTKTYPNAKVEEKQVDFGNGTSVAAYQAGKAEAEATSAENKQAVATYLAEKAEVDRKNAETKAKEEELKQKNLASDEGSKLYVTGEFDTNAKGLDYYKNIKVTSLDKESHAVQSLGWQDNTALESPIGLTVTKLGEENRGLVKLYYKVEDTTVGDSFILRNVGKTVDGKNINAKVTLTRASALTDTSKSHFKIGKTIDGGVAVNYWNYDRLGLSFDYFGDDNEPLKLVLASVIGDVDYGQTASISFKGNSLHYINPEGSGLTPNADKSLSSDSSLVVEGYQHAPLGTFLMAGSSSTVDYVHTTDSYALVDGKVGAYVEFALFGTSSFVEVEEFKYLDNPQLVLKTVTNPPKAILKENLATNYHLNTYVRPLTVSKDVVNLSGVSINGGDLKIGEKAIYTLQGAKVFANGKDKLVKYDFEDNLDIEHDKYLDYKIYAFTLITLTDGTILESMADLKDFAKQTYDKATGRFYVSLNSDFLARVSKDSDFQAAVDILFERIKTGDVTNTFNNYLAFEDTEGNVTEVPVLSNEVITHTLEEPEVPEAPKAPESPSPISNIPVQSSAVLPETGDVGSILGIIGGMLISGLGLAGICKRKAN
ncbi:MULTISPECIES: LPXTG cell wall anchor domain-containing protein [unclassified Streptococcus]|uniref:LPXTG cell wall anchor domain-containing protein n=1 Tax=unclassified Streptococcus TaxID=2608887 RepID=UPI001071EC5A|nr:MULTISPECIES: LPXTG cell wall anchor domain-containing protein [unclassified Streptococcus]MBF0786946.1 LPXTG cell wall anchor domain-containing protein [Streptococcus sp. 19428wC2_LYSM12]MCQ9211490.1 LPXTG cell wall anchor domain-containing protein [Streptococcus sp. B01]MCQ9214806.1 LPXTG cell wall anchor domain-containing protein [Streptococcus sp. O1]TFV06145.1 LPXTG cell wall anchor domain-containing protein [Streptococcus sp. LYSM12]